MSVARETSPRTNRRQSERQEHRSSVKLVSGQAGAAISYVGLTENLSEEGAFVATRAPWAIGSTVEVTIGPVQQKFVHARARVRWRRFASSINGTVPGIGLRFERLSAEDANTIREFVSLKRCVPAV
jgi:uncharacterized protein (TIGR02266 family)